MSAFAIRAVALLLAVLLGLLTTAGTAGILIFAGVLLVGITLMSRVFLSTASHLHRTREITQGEVEMARRVFGEGYAHYLAKVSKKGRGL